MGVGGRATVPARHVADSGFSGGSAMSPVPVLVLVVLAAAAAAPRSLEAQSASARNDDLVIGTWHLDVAKSTYSPGPGPISETRTYTRGPNGLEGTIRRRFAGGRSERIEYVAEYDREYPVTGTEDYDHILLKRVDARTAEAVLMHAGRVYGTARRAIAESGKTMTITFQQEGTSGRLVKTSAFYEKAEP